VLLLIANGISTLLGLARGFYIARILSPSDYGAWTLLSVLLNYTNYTDMGVNTGFILKVPGLIGQGRLDEAQRVQRQAYTATLIVCGAIALVVVLISFLSLGFSVSTIAILHIVAVAILVTAVLNYYQVVARIQNKFLAFSLSGLLAAGVALGGVIVVGVLPLTFKVELVGYVSVLAAAAAALLLSMTTRSAPLWPPNWRDISRLVAIGLPVGLLPIVFTLFQSVDRWVVAVMVPVANLGYYGLGATLGLLLFMIPNTLAVVLFTRQIEQFGATGDPRSSESLVLPPLQFSGYIMALMAGGTVMVVPFIIYYLLPNYLPATRVAIFQVIGNCLLFAVPISTQFLASVKQIWRVFSVLLMGALIEALLVALLVLTPLGIDGAALAVLISDAIYSIAIAFLVVRLFSGTLLGQFSRVALYFLPFSICLPVAWFILIMNHVRGELWSDLLRLAEYGALYLLVCGPLCLLTAWLSGLLHQPFAATRIRRWLPIPLVDVLLGKGEIR